MIGIRFRQNLFMSIVSIFRVYFSDLLFGWDGERWDDLLLGGLLLGLSLEDFLEEFLVLLLTSFVFILGSLLVAVVTSSANDEGNKGNDHNRSSTSRLLGKLISLLSTCKSSFSYLKSSVCSVKSIVCVLKSLFGGIFISLINIFVIFDSIISLLSIINYLLS